MSGHGGLVDERLPALPSSVADARRLVRQTLTSAGRDDLIDSAELLVSEVVTNAVVHAGTPIGLQVTIQGSTLRVEVSDGSPHLPARRNYTEFAGTGRGLMLVEQLVDRWGVHTHADGKTVWFDLSSSDLTRSYDSYLVGPHSMDVDAFPEAEPSGFSPEVLDIGLFDVPLLLHSAWQMHAESILREYLLAKLDDDNAAELIECSAAANDAMSIFREQIPAPDLGDDPGELMAAATEPLVSLKQMTLRVPASSLPSFKILDETLEAAFGLAESGIFLTAPIQPEMRMMRSWLCEQVIEQSGGGVPRPWSLNGQPQPPSAPTSGVDDASDVSDSTLSLVVADDNNRIVSMSRSAVQLLGYDHPNDLVGRRLVDIIPIRYHQAHLAGFTLHLAAGRSPLLGRPVTVPALRQDGTEVSVRLVVEAQRRKDGRRFFVAELVPAQ